jgi:hypothetical protein
MDSTTLVNILEMMNAAAKTKHSLGVYASDRLPSRFNRPAAFIIHSETSKEFSGHWMAVYVPQRGPKLFFDSYGLNPFVENQVNFLKRVPGKLLYNKVCYQSLDTSVCGAYCIMFIAYQMRLVKTPLKLDPNDTRSNDIKVAKAVQQLVERLERTKDTL